MKRLGLRLMRRKPVQASAQLTLTASAAPPDSGFAALRNSQGASEALNEFCGALAGVLEHIDVNDASDDSFEREQVRRLETAASEYSNSSAAACHRLEEWRGPQSLAQVISVAFACAASVYEKPPKSTAGVNQQNGSSAGGFTGHRRPETEGVTFTELKYIGPSSLGTSKAMGVWKAEPKAACDGLPSLVIAIRGTAGFLDSMVNANSWPVPAGEFLGVSEVSSIRELAMNISVHGGFLNSAESLDSSVSRILSQANVETPGIGVVFTGHSAGGAVATILFVKALLGARKHFSTLKFSCITFGAPPALDMEMAGPLQRDSTLAQNRGCMLALINEFDMVPRADQVYVRSILELYQSTYSIQPLMDDAESAERQSSPDTDDIQLPPLLPPLEFQAETDLNNGSKPPDDEGTWKLPSPGYHVFGDIIMLRREPGWMKTLPASAGKIRAETIPLDEYEKLIFCGVQTHSRSYYGERVELLRQGNFNHRESW